MSNLTVEALIEQQVRLSPQAPAVSYQGESLSYQELDSRANRLANYLQDQGITANSLVGICLDRSFELIISVLAILKAGAAYLPLDQAYPADRLRLMIEDSAVAYIITQKHLDGALPSIGAKRIFLDCEAECIARCPNSQPSKQTTPDNLAYVIYTSGSTGKPKGVAMHHRPLVNLLNWQKQQFKTTKARTLQFTPISFDVSFQEIFSTLSSGGTLILIGDTDRRNSETLLARLCEDSVERLFLPFIALQNLAEAATKAQQLPVTLQEIVTAGEQLKVTRSIASLFGRLENCSLVNQYGPSESHVVTQHILTGTPREWPHLPPIGQAIDNTQLFLLKTQSRREGDPIALAEPGEPGELAIGGVCLAKGYLNQPELTRKRFIENPFVDEPGAILYRTGDLVKRSTTGELEYVERLDDQVKVRGVRIELGEVEAQISQHSMVKANAILPRKRADGTTYLVAYIVPNSSEYLEHSAELELQLRAFIKERLPECMIPAFFEFLPTLPLTPSGKIDRRSLPEPVQKRPTLGQEYLQPRTDVERKLAELWSKVLEFKKIGIKDNFFEFGGDSLRAVQLIHLVCETFKIELPIVALFDDPTIEALSPKIQNAVNSDRTATSDDISPEELESQTVTDLTDVLTTHPLEFSTQPKNVLITGVTGFLGAFLLRELLEQTQADVYCLVRAANDAAGIQKIKNNLEKYGIWQVSYRDRIKPVVGDLGKPQLGVSDDTLETLSRDIQAIYHSGAAISLIHPYSTLHQANVKGTEELLRIASRYHLKPFHFISTLDVFQTPDDFSHDPLMESSPLQAINAVKFDGYTKSKWVSEKMVWRAGEQGLPISVYRPAMISGNSQTGICNTGDLMNRLIKGFIQLGAAPESDMVINIAPVDFFSKGLIYLSLKHESLGKGFNFINPRPVSMKEFVAAINDCGYNIQQVTYQEWQNLLTQNIRNVDGIVSVLTSKEDLSKPSYIERSSVNAKQVSCQNVLNGLLTSDIRCPEINGEFLQPYLNYYIQTGFLSPHEMGIDEPQPVKVE